MKFTVVPLENLTSSEIELYQALSLPSAHPLLTEKQSHFAIEARLDDRLVGLMLVALQGYRAQVQSIMVLEPFRKQGIGTSLFGFFQDFAIQQEQIKTLEIQYEQSSFSAPIIEKWLSLYQWGPGTLFLVRCFFDVYRFHPPWFQRPFHTPPNAEIFNLKNLQPADRMIIRHWEEQGRLIPYLSPYFDEDQIEPLNSFGMRYNEQITGWCITHRKDPETIHYFALFMNQDLHLSGLGIALLAHSIRMQQVSPIRWAVFEANLKYIEPAWKRFILKRLMPYADKIERIKSAYKSASRDGQ
ncbi:MAG: GNAT family N-acetyltransferase [Chlamydiales bacterium]